MLQGSLDNFALDEVLGLLSSTSKTGRLELKGDRGTGVVLMHEGQLVDATASNTSNGTTPEDVVFELLRFEEGSFVFDGCQLEPGEASLRIGDVLSAAEARLADWRTIEAVVPSLANHVDTVAELPADEVTIDRDEWATLRVIAAGCPASLVCDQLAVGEVEGSRRIKRLAERGLVTVGPPISSSPTSAPTGTAGRFPEAHDPPLVDTPLVETGFVDTASIMATSDAPATDEARRAAIQAAAQEKAALARAILARTALSDAESTDEDEDENPGVEPRDLAEGPRVAPVPDEGAPAPRSQDDARSGGLLMRYLKADD